MQQIIIKTVPDDKQRYNTVGDYYTDEEGNRVFVISEMKNWKYEFLVAIHELVESALCNDRGITDKSIDEFDLQFEQQRDSHNVSSRSEPGDSEEAPYHDAHIFATKIEKLVAEQLNVDWDEYDSDCKKLYSK